MKQRGRKLTSANFTDSQAKPEETSRTDLQEMRSLNVNMHC